MNIPKYIESFRKDLFLKNYSENTIKNYSSQIELFLKNHLQFTEPAKINEITIKEIDAWIKSIDKDASFSNAKISLCVD